MSARGGLFLHLHGWVLVLALAWPLATAAQAADTLVVEGAVADRLALDVAALERLPQHDVAYRSSRGERREDRGVRLRDVILLARPLAPDRLALRQTLVVVRATDGYIALFTWAELFLTQTGDNVFVVHRRNGQTLPDGEGRFALVSAADRDGGPRRVRWLTHVELRRIER